MVCAMSKPLAFLIAAVSLFALMVWSPWMTRKQAESRVVDHFSSSWEGVVDGCGFYCEGCGAKPARRLVVGFSVEIEYACGLIPEDTPEFHQAETAYVSPFGTVHGLNTP